MCGVSGLVLRSWDQDFANAFVAASAKYLARRGPDAFNSKRVTSNLVLVQTRLAIIDLVGGKQPMSDTDGSIVFNGEIYNYREVKDRGINYETNSDTEVLLKGLNNLGTAYLNQIDGMFAFAHFDERRNLLTLGRDRFGIKPLYYFADSNRIAFASRLQPLMLLSAGEINRKAVAEYYFTRAIRGSNTIFTDIAEVLPGEAIVFDLKSFKVVKKGIWAEPGVVNRQEHNAANALEALDEAMQLSIDRHLVADVPVASLLSGGVDSGLVTALAASRREDLSAFSIGFQDQAFDETRFASAICQQYRIRHHVYYCDSSDFSSLLMEWPEIMDDVVADPSAVAAYVLSQFVHDSGYKVVLSGEGADELFGGYNQYFRFQLARSLYPYGRHFPWGIDIIRRLTHGQSRYMHFAHTALRDPSYYGTGMIFEPHLVKELVDQPDVLSQKRSDLNGALDLDLGHRIPDDILTRTDRATMHASIEARVPFLTQYVASVSWTFGEDLLLNGRTRKPILKQLAAKYIPLSCINRPKKGFDVPLSQWFRNDLKSFVCDTLSSTWQNDYLIPGAMQGVIEDHLTGRNDNADKIWAFVLLEGNVRHLRSIQPSMFAGVQPQCPNM